ncbi:MAG: sodium:solute symporter family protein [Oscillospiraceae bacterium]|jgi:SSS family solute:Na+ symporter|nr:sodium:solute symporter family protein [Oscillospiraceae bacterium]
MDILIVIGYLGFLLFYGIYQGYRVKNVKEFSLSGKRHGLFVVFAALSAAFIGGGFSSGNATEVFKNGTGNILGLCGFSLGQIIIGFFMLKRVRLPQNASSPGMIMQGGYGKYGRIVSGVSATLLCVGLLGAQIAAIGWIFNVLLNVPYAAGVVIGFAVVLVYSTAGGMSAIITAEIVEFLLLSIGLPILLICSVRYVGGVNALMGGLPPERLNPFKSMEAGSLISLFITMMIGEALTPTYIQRILMAKDKRSISKATILSGVVSAPVFIITGFVGMCAFVANPNMQESLAMPYMVIHAMPVGLKGLVMAAMLAIVMSSADGLLSSAAIGLVNDVLAPLSKKKPSEGRQLRLIRAVTVLLGVIGMGFAIYSGDVFGLLLLAYAAWAPVMLAPLLALLMGKRISIKGFLLCGGAGAGTAVFFGAAGISPFGMTPSVAGFLINLTMFLAIYSLEKRKK